MNVKLRQTITLTPLNSAELKETNFKRLNCFEIENWSFKLDPPSLKFSVLIAENF